MNDIALAQETPNSMIEIIRRSLSDIDPRLMEHGERVAYLAFQILKGHDRALELDTKALFLLSILHDVGAYKTDEIGDMLQFELQDVQSHAVYGYLFLCHAADFGEAAKAVLYHHTDYADLLEKDISPETRDYAALIHLADRIDVLTHGGRQANLNVLRAMAGKRFSPEFVDWFFEAEEQRGILRDIRTGAYRDSVDRAIQTCRLDGNQASEFLKMLVYAIDFRSPFTVTHTADTMAFANALGKRMELGEADMHALRYGAFLHDVGKIAIPVEILENPGRLTPEERAVMETHVVITGEIIAGFVPGDVYSIACRHHEKLDGSGYPLGLTAGELTLSERIVAVADITSALVGRRSYKLPMEKEQVLSILTQMAEQGKLDKTCCQVLEESYDAILQEVTEDRKPIIAAYETISRQYTEMMNRAEQRERERKAPEHGSPSDA